EHFLDRSLAYDQPVPAGEVCMDGYDLFRAARVGRRQDVAQKTLLLVQHLPYHLAAVGVLEAEQVRTLRLGVDDCRAEVGAWAYIKNVEIAGLAQLDRADLLLEHLHVLADVDPDVEHADDLAVV